MKSDTDTSSASEYFLPATKSAAVLLGLILTGVVIRILNRSLLAWRIPPQTPGDYGNIVLFSLTVIVFCVSIWQLGWILLALIAEKSNSLTLRILIHRFGTKWARALLSSSLALTGFSGNAMAAIQPEQHSYTVSTSSQTYYRLETPHLFPTQQTSDRNQPLVKGTEISDFTWGANLQTRHSIQSKARAQTSSHQTYRILKGDSLWKIAKNILNQQSLRASNQEINKYVIKLYRQNKKVIGSNPNLIYPGMTLTLPLVGDNLTDHKSLEGTK